MSLAYRNPDKNYNKLLTEAGNAKGFEVNYGRNRFSVLESKKKEDFKDVLDATSAEKLLKELKVEWDAIEDMGGGCVYTLKGAVVAQYDPQFANVSIYRDLESSLPKPEEKPTEIKHDHVTEGKSVSNSEVERILQTPIVLPFYGNKKYNIWNSSGISSVFVDDLKKEIDVELLPQLPKYRKETFRNIKFALSKTKFSAYRVIDSGDSEDVYEPEEEIEGSFNEEDDPNYEFIEVSEYEDAVAELKKRGVVFTGTKETGEGYGGRTIVFYNGNKEVAFFDPNGLGIYESKRRETKESSNEFGTDKDFPIGSRVTGQMTPDGKDYSGKVIGHSKTSDDIYILTDGGKKVRLTGISVSKMQESFNEEDDAIVSVGVTDKTVADDIAAKNDGTVKVDNKDPNKFMVVKKNESKLREFTDPQVGEKVIATDETPDVPVGTKGVIKKVETQNKGTDTEIEAYHIQWDNEVYGAYREVDFDIVGKSQFESKLREFVCIQVPDELNGKFDEEALLNSGFEVISAGAGTAEYESDMSRAECAKVIKQIFGKYASKVNIAPEGYMDEAKKIFEGQNDVEGLRRQIKKASDSYGESRNNHTIISMGLNQLGSRYGKDARNKAVKDFNLDVHGFQVKEEYQSPFQEEGKWSEQVSEDCTILPGEKYQMADGELFSVDRVEGQTIYITTAAGNEESMQYQEFDHLLHAGQMKKLEESKYGKLAEKAVLMHTLLQKPAGTLTEKQKEFISENLKVELSEQDRAIVESVVVKKYGSFLIKEKKNETAS